MNLFRIIKQNEDEKEEENNSSKILIKLFFLSNKVRNSINSVKKIIINKKRKEGNLMS